jgi:flagellar M-ring protein FliF
VRPLIRAFRPDKPSAPVGEPGLPDAPGLSGLGQLSPPAAAPQLDSEMLSRQVSLAQRMVEEQPESAVIALRKMLQANTTEPVR